MGKHIRNLRSIDEIVIGYLFRYGDDECQCLCSRWVDTRYDRGSLVGWYRDVPAVTDNKLWHSGHPSGFHKAVDVVEHFLVCDKALRIEGEGCYALHLHRIFTVNSD